ncbi:MAG: nitroreductase family protein [Sutterellaceae bacterium]|nr:nitroreductase family protein [Sutterellaceae bacterium]MDY2867658.1 nitroreductase family protein [Mesosutterella sp.]
MSRTLETARKRFTAKVYDQERSLSPEEWAEVLEILRLAPSSVNYQPVQYFTADTPEALDRIAACVADFNRERVTKAGHAIVCAVPFGPEEEHFKAVLSKEIADGRYAGKENQAGLDAGRRHFAELNALTPADFYEWASKQAYLAMGYLLFALGDMGIDATIMEGADFKALDRELGLREKGLASVLVLSVGRHDEERDRNARKPKSRLPMDALFQRIAPRP